MMSIRNSYSKEYKEEVIRLAQRQGNQSQTARDVGLPSSVLSRWIKELKEDPEKAFPGKGRWALALFVAGLPKYKRFR